MVKYEWRCDECGKTLTARLEAGNAPDAIYHSCGGMFRRQYGARMNMSGLRELHPNVRRLIDDAPRRRDEYEAIHHD